MKSISWQLGLAAAFAALTMFGRATPAMAADEDQGGPGDRIERLERRVNEMAQRQEQLLRRLEEQQQRQAPMGAMGRGDMRPGRTFRGRAGIGQPMPPAGAPAFAGVPAPAAAPAPAATCGRDLARLVKLCLLVALVFNILLAVWIYTDIRKRGEGSGIFIALALLAGIPTAIIYSIVRIGDKKT